MRIVILCKCMQCGSYVDQSADGDTEDMIQWHLERIARGMVEVKQIHVCSRSITLDIRGALQPVGVRIFK